MHLFILYSNIRLNTKQNNPSKWVSVCFRYYAQSFRQFAKTLSKLHDSV